MSCILTSTGRVWLGFKEKCIIARLKIIMCTSAGCKILHLIKKAEKSGSSISYWFLNLVSNILTIIVDVHLKSYIEMSWVPI